MPYFAGRLLERNGEKEYSHDNIIKAKNLEKAKEIYDQYCREFYSDDDPEKEDDGYLFFGGEIYVGVASIRPTTKKEWMEYQFDLNLIGRRRE